MRKKITGFDKQIALHMEKLAKAAAEGNQIGMDYWAKEISNFETQRKKWQAMTKPKN